MIMVFRYCETEIPILLSRLFERFAINYINKLIYGFFDQSAIYGNVEYTKTVSNEGTKIEMQQIWTVPNFSNLLNNKYVHPRPCYSPKGRREWEFQLAVQIDRSPDSISIFYKSPTQVLLKSAQLKCYTFDKYNWVYDQNQSIIGKEDRRIVEANKWYVLKRLSIVGSYLQDGSKILFLKNGNLFLKFEFVITVDKESKEHLFNIPGPQLSNDMDNLFLKGIYTDVVMISADEKKFKVHKAVLVSRSAVLKAHFKHKMTESITNVVESPLESIVLSELLLFIYSDEAPKVNEIPDKLLAAADYYQLSRLKSLCEEALYKKLTVDNAIETLQLADLHSANTLKEHTLEFIKDGRQSLVSKTEGWAKLQSVELMRTICD